MNQFQDIESLRTALASSRRRGETVALVATMGNLHEGHLTLIDHARELADQVLCSIFVNPTQFGPGEDFESYPRTLDDDCAQLEQRRCDAVFAPTVAQLYPRGREAFTRVSVPGLTDVLCGASRPGHFDGVTTVVSMLLHLVEPQVAVFGEKDYQQLLIIQRMVDDLHINVDVRGAPIVRAADGLALSSRNRYLSESERSVAPTLRRELLRLTVALGNGGSIADMTGSAAAALKGAGFAVDYLQVLDEATLRPPEQHGRWRVFAAANLGQTRLIDNAPIVWE